MEEYLKANPVLLAALITAVAGVVLAALNFLFNRWNSTHNKNLEIRATVYNKKIQEAREYAENLDIQILSFRSFYRILLDKPSAFSENFAYFMEEFADLPKRIHDVTLSASIINRINDKKLKKLDYELSILIIPIIENYLDVFEKLFSRKKVHFRDIDLEKLVFPDEVDYIITRMKNRLDELASKVK